MCNCNLLLQDPRDIVELLALQMDFIFNATMEDPLLIRSFMCLLHMPNCQRHFASVLLQFLLNNHMSSLERPGSKVKMGVLILRTRQLTDLCREILGNYLPKFCAL